jgi:hypothetical protein
MEFPADDLDEKRILAKSTQKLKQNLKKPSLLKGLRADSPQSGAPLALFACMRNRAPAPTPATRHRQDAAKPDFRGR